MENEIKIDRTEVMQLYESCIGSLSVHSIGQWLKSKTDGKFVIIPRENAKQIVDCSVNIKELSDELTYAQNDIEKWM